MDQLVCGNEVLADAMTPFHPRQTVVIPTCIDTQRFVPSTTRQSGGVCKYGWIATSSNFPFLLELKAAFIEAAAQCQFELHVMTDPSPQWEELKNWPIKVECHAWSPAREIEFVQKCDIGLMPLPDTSWTRQKCGCKLLLSMACSRPVIASPVGTNRQIAPTASTASGPRRQMSGRRPSFDWHRILNCGQQWGWPAGSGRSKIIHSMPGPIAGSRPSLGRHPPWAQSPHRARTRRFPAESAIS